MKNLFARYIQEEHAATAIEYGLIAAGIGMAIVVTVGLVGGDLDATFTAIEGFL